MEGTNQFEILIPLRKDISSGGELKLFGGIATSLAVDRDTERMDKAVLPKIAKMLMQNSTVFFNHDTKGLGVGIIKSAEVRGDEVHIEVIPTHVAGMQDVVGQIREGVLKSFSIGGKVLDWENQFDEKLGKNVRLIKDVSVYEVSVVGVPSNPEASILSQLCKSFKTGGSVADETLKKDTVPAPGPGQTLGKESDPKESDGDEKKPGVMDKSFYKCHKCAAVMDKCASCGEPVPAHSALTETALGPGETETMHLSMKNDFEKSIQKAMTDIDAKVESRAASLEKSYKVREDEFKKQIAAATARIDDLHVHLEKKSKALEAENELQKQKESESNDTTTASAPVNPGFMKQIITG